MCVVLHEALSAPRPLYVINGVHVMACMCLKCYVCGGMVFPVGVYRGRGACLDVLCKRKAPGVHEGSSYVVSHLSTVTFLAV